jgi:hypothetical protein
MFLLERLQSQRLRLVIDAVTSSRLVLVDLPNVQLYVFIVYFTSFRSIPFFVADEQYG